MSDDQIESVIMDLAKGSSQTIDTDGSDPLSDAIRNTVDAAFSAEGPTLLILNKHLSRLCDLQYARLTGLDE